MTPTGENTFRKEFEKSQERMKEAFTLDLKDAKKRNNMMNTAYGHLFGELAPGSQTEFFNAKPKQKRVLVVGGAYHGRQAMIDMIAKLKEEMAALSPCIALGNMLPHGIVINSSTLLKIKGRDFKCALPGLKQAQEALKQLGQCGLNASEAGANLAKGMKEMLKVKTENDDSSISYGRKQAQHWAHKYSTKIRRKL